MADSKVPSRAERPSGMDHLFNRPSALDDPAIDPDRVGPVVEGYFHLPPVWVGEEPQRDTIKYLNPSVHHSVAHRGNMRCGIKVRVNRDGLFLFDFTSWPPAAPIIIPGYIRPEIGTEYIVPHETQEAENKAEDNAMLRAQVLNAHQICLITARWQIEKKSLGFGFPVTAWSTHKSLSLDIPPSYYDDIENLHALAHNIVNNKDRIERENPLSRSILSLGIVRRSFEILDDILATGNLAGLRLVEGCFMAMNRRRENRFGEAITLGWTVCEQLISLAWRKMMDDVQANSPDRMSKDRRKKLSGRDYTASVMIELLEIQGVIDKDLFRMLEISRKARNAWAHEMRSPHDSIIQVCLTAAQQLLRQILGIEVIVNHGAGRGGVPQWPVWMWSGYRA